MKCTAAILILLLTCSSSLFCQVKDSVQSKNDKIIELLEDIQKQSTNTIKKNYDTLNVEIDQLIINETISKLGLDFQEIFYSKWNWPPALSDPFIIVITERPIFGTSTQIEISVNDIKVFENFLQPRYDVLEETAMQAVSITTQYILNFQEVLKQLSGDDMAGTGIY